MTCFEKMRATFAVMLLLVSPLTAAAAPAKPLALENPLTWPHTSVAAFACMMEKEWGNQDAFYGCTTADAHTGNPCQEDTNYYAGPIFPTEFTSKVSPAIASIDLAWEDAYLQSVTVHFKKRMSKAEIEKAFKTSVKEDNIQECGDATCLVMVGFAHKGPDDVDCDEGTKKQF